MPTGSNDGDRTSSPASWLGCWAILTWGARQRRSRGGHGSRRHGLTKSVARGIGIVYRRRRRSRRHDCSYSTVTVRLGFRPSTSITTLSSAFAPVHEIVTFRFDCATVLWKEGLERLLIATTGFGVGMGTRGFRDTIARGSFCTTAGGCLGATAARLFFRGMAIGDARNFAETNPGVTGVSVNRYDSSCLI
jgi:hypothetical protein